MNDFNKYILNICCFILTFFLNNVSFAIEVYNYQEDQINLQKDTIVFVLGAQARELGAGPVLTAISRIKEYQRFFPHRQFIVLDITQDNYIKNNEIIKDNRGSIFNQKVLLNHSFFKAQTHDQIQWSNFELTVENLVIFLKKFKPSSIHSLEFFTHGDTLLGPLLQGDLKQSRILQNLEKIASLKPFLSLDAYVLFHGCNTGWMAAPVVAQVLKIPVAGSLTGVQFHYRRDFELDFHQNSKNLKASELCHKQSCVKMLPNNFTYEATPGEGSSFSGGGLGFFKFFCPVDQNQRPTENCARAMAWSVLGSPMMNTEIENMSLVEQFKIRAADIVCGSSADTKCRLKLINSKSDEPLNYSGFNKTTLNCGFIDCRVKLDCSFKTKSNPLRNYCILKQDQEKESTPKANTTYWSEYQTYLRGIKLILSSDKLKLQLEH